MADSKTMQEQLTIITADNKKLKKQMEALTTSVETKLLEIMAAIVKKDHNIEALFNVVETKLDIFTNMEGKSAASAAGSASAAKKPARLTPLAFLKTELSSNMTKHMGALYSQEDLDRLHENVDVKKKKTPADKNTKIISLLAAEIKKDSLKSKILDELKDAYSQAIKTDELIE
jgi:uncharacterized protein YqgV (UPF0045/DUF77 family)